MGYIMDLRKELGHRPLIMAGAGVVILNSENEILLQKRADNGFWGYPAGSMELGESFEECAKREAFEESGINCDELDPVNADIIRKVMNGTPSCGIVMKSGSSGHTSAAGEKKDHPCRITDAPFRSDPVNGTSIESVLTY